MQISRRSLLLVGVVSGLPGTARAADPRLGERSVGAEGAAVVVREFFSLTCPHCARFAHDVLPQIHSQLIAPGKLRMVFHDFPLDRLALTAAAVARTLPAERYEPFVLSLLASQDRWAFARGVNNTEELFKFAALAGLSRDSFNAAINDRDLANGILQAQETDTKTYNIDSTPTFIVNSPKAKDERLVGERPYQDFADAVAKAAA